MLIKIQNAPGDRFFFEIAAGNGEKVATSDLYDTKEKCVRTARQIANAGTIEIGDFTKKKSPMKKAETLGITDQVE